VQPVIADNPEGYAASSAVIVTNLIKQFGRFAALRGVTAEFAAGRLYAILVTTGRGRRRCCAPWLDCRGRREAAFLFLGRRMFVRFARKWVTWRIHRCFMTK